jgi:hypothetical protein
MTTESAAVSVDLSSSVDDFLRSVKRKYCEDGSNPDFHPSQNKNFQDFDERDFNEEKKESSPWSAEDLLAVVVQSSKSTTRNISQSSLTKSTPRQKRWEKITSVLEKKTVMYKYENATRYAYVIWNEVKSIFEPTTYDQPKRKMKDELLDDLVNYLACASKSFKCQYLWHDTLCLHYISSVLIYVCNHFDGDVQIAVEEHLVGKAVKAHAHFEFVLRRGKKVVCIFQAKDNNFRQGVLQCMIGCEVAAEVDGLDVVYGIVTNHVRWYFLRSLNDKVEMNGISLMHSDKGTERESLKNVAEKIYAMLSDD